MDHDLVRLPVPTMAYSIELDMRIWLIRNAEFYRLEYVDKPHSHIVVTLPRDAAVAFKLRWL